MAQAPTIESESTSPPAVDHQRAAIVLHGQAFGAAVQFLTRVPVPGGFVGATEDAPRLQLATIYFPLVGSCIGLTTGMAIWLASQLWPTWLAVLLGLAIEALLTGALHEDALADCCDALGGGWTRADVLRILDDSRLGTYGVLGLTIAFLLRAGSIAALDARLLFAAIVASATLGRWAMILAMAWLPPVPERPSLAQQAGRQTFRYHVLWAAALSIAGLLPLALMAPARLALSLAVVFVVTAWFAYHLRRRVGGMTGDGAGAICYLAQIAVLLCCSVSAKL